MMETVLFVLFFASYIAMIAILMKGFNPTVVLLGVGI